ncbi:unnamed protein product [Adineta ricciae]|uniref:Uncharacterized protein n=1 Tax=Adineta ricciae TaxID=249248 RepID=A0A814SVE3_ADIRI|nr:unnamed protein product [Adineta ricciae]CAF1153356.1 unnamed protein product [Adineta ricciae]
MILFITLATFCPNQAESRAVHNIYKNGQPSHIAYLRLGDNDELASDDNSGENQDVYTHTKRKSELLSSLYGLPYALARKRQAN